MENILGVHLFFKANLIILSCAKDRWRLKLGHIVCHKPLRDVANW